MSVRPPNSWLASRSPAQLFFIFAVISLPFTLKVHGSIFRLDTWPVTAQDGLFMADLVNQWLGGRAALNGEFKQLFDKDVHRAEVLRWVGHPDTSRLWSYPPPALFLAAPLGWFTSFAWVCLVWTVVGIVVWAMALMRPARDQTWVDKSLVLLGTLITPLVYIGVSFGQTALLTSAALLVGLRWATRHPMYAGAMFAAFICKPQLAMAVPAALIGLQARRAFVTTASFSIVGLLATLAWFGFEPWRLFVEITLPQQSRYLDPTADIPVREAIPPTMQHSLAFIGLAIGFPASVFLVAHIAIAVAVVTSLIAILRIERNDELRFLAFALASLLISPYLLSYETALLVMAAARVAMDSDASQRLGRFGCLALFFSATSGCFIALALAPTVGVNLSPLLVLGLFVWRAVDTIRGPMMQSGWFGRPHDLKAVI